MTNGPRASHASRPLRAPAAAAIGEKRIPESYIVILQPTVAPYEMLSSVLKGYKPTFTYGSIFTGFAVDRVPLQKADEVSIKYRVHVVLCVFVPGCFIMRVCRVCVRKLVCGFPRFFVCLKRAEAFHPRR